MLLEQSAILFTLDLPYLGVYALVLWFGYLYLTWIQFRIITRRK